MSKSVTLGGERLGSGKKQKISMHGYQRSTHDLGNVVRTSMACGTLVPFMSQVALPGDTFDIELEAFVRTLPTIGPLFGSFKLQLDVFVAPMRLYIAPLHNNALNVGLKMEQIKLPQLKIKARDINPDSGTSLEFQQINQSSLLAYLGTRGLGRAYTDGGVVERRVPLS